MKRVRLAARRRTVGLSQEALAEQLGVDRSTILRWENGERTPQPWQRPNLAAALKVTAEELDDLLAGKASSDADERLNLALNRPRAVDLVMVGYLREQVMRLDERYEQTPSSSLLAAAGRLHGQATYLRSQVTAPKILRALWTVEAESALLVGQLVWDATQRRDHEGSRLYFDNAIAAAKEAGESTVEAYAHLRKGYLALYGTNDPCAGLALTQRAAIASTRSPVVRGLAALHRGEAHAMLGDRGGCEAALGEAEQEFSRMPDDDPAAALFCPTSHGRLAGSCHLHLGEPARAEQILEDAYRQLKRQKKSTAIVLGNLALACIRQKKLDDAAARLHQAIDVLERTRGGGGLNVVSAAVRELKPWRRENAVAEVNDRLLALMTAA